VVCHAVIKNKGSDDGQDISQPKYHQDEAKNEAKSAKALHSLPVKPEKRMSAGLVCSQE
jgi:hypothetical protein